MASKTFNIDSFPKGYFMSWCVTTQAAYKVNVKLYDDKSTYFSGSRQSRNAMPPLSVSAADIAGNNLKINIDIPESNKIESSINTYSITTNNGTIVGYGYNISVEDSADNDYNDVCISLVAWKNKG